MSSKKTDTFKLVVPKEKEPERDMPAKLGLDSLAQREQAWRSTSQRTGAQPALSAAPSRGSAEVAAPAPPEHLEGTLSLGIDLYVAGLVHHAHEVAQDVLRVLELGAEHMEVCGDD